MKIKAQNLLIKLSIPVAVLIGTIVPNLSLDRVFAQTITALVSSNQCTETNIKASINKLETGDTAAFDFLVSCDSAAVLSLIELLQDEDQNNRIVAIAILGEIGESATEAIPFLEEILKDTQENNKDNKFIAVDALAKMGQSAVPVLIAVLEDKNEDSSVRSSAAKALGEIGTKAEDAIPALIAALENGSSLIRSDATKALSKIGQPAISALIAILENKNEDSWVHRAAKALGEIGTKAKDAVPALIAILEDKNEDSSVRSSAAEALGGIGTGAKDAIPFLISILQYDDEIKRYIPLRYSSVKALGEIRVGSKEAVPILTSVAQNDRCLESRQAAIESLKQINPDQVYTFSNQHENISSCESSLFDFQIEVGTLASTLINKRETNPPIMCRYPLIKAILPWKCP